MNSENPTPAPEALTTGSDSGSAPVLSLLSAQRSRVGKMTLLSVEICLYLVLVAIGLRWHAQHAHLLRTTLFFSTILTWAVAHRLLGRRLYFNPVELRAGWRFAIFLCIVIAMFGLVGLIVGLFIHPTGPANITELTPQMLISQDSLSFGIVLFASFIMSKLETRKLAAYGLSLRAGFLRNFGIGVLWGFVALSGLIGIFAVRGDFHINSVNLHGSQLILYPLVWAFAFLLVGLSEEYTFRGYPQYTLTTGMGFWPAAILFSVGFGGVHYLNPGEKLLGLVQVVTVALFFCFTLWRTGTLWFAVGFHAGWDWAQTCFYGTSDSGLGGAHHLLNSTTTGATWFSGGSVGPEGSFLNIPLDLLLIVLFYFAFKKGSPYPDPGRALAPVVAPTPQGY